MNNNKCKCCKGKAWIPAAQDTGLENIPILLRPIRLCKCPCCEGTGKHLETKDAYPMIIDLIATIKNDEDIIFDTMSNIDKIITTSNNN